MRRRPSTWNEAFATGDLAFIGRGLGVIARARGIAKGASVSRESTLSGVEQGGGNPELGAPPWEVMGAMGLQFRVAKPRPIVVLTSIFTRSDETI